VSSELNRRDLIKGISSLALAAAVPGTARALAGMNTGTNNGTALPMARPKPAERRFTSPAVEELVKTMRTRIADPNLATIFENCFPNTLDTTVTPGSFAGHPDTYVVTGDIDAMWLRDSSAQVWPYLPLCKEDAKLRTLLAGVIRRQARMILIDPYANAFTRDPNDPPLSWAVADKTTHKPGVGERKWEVDSLCYTVRLAHGYWQATGDTSVFDSQWKEAAHTIVRTFREQQRKSGPGPYSFQRQAFVPSDTLALKGFGSPGRPVGLIFSMFRPSDDACTFPLFIPANLFAVVTLRRLAEIADRVFGDPGLANDCHGFAQEVEAALKQYGTVNDHRFGEIWAYEVDGYGNVLKMDDANAPGLLSLAYLGCCAIDDPRYLRSRSFALSDANPYFYRGTAAEGIGGPHEGPEYVWPMSILMRAFTSTSDSEIRQCLRWLRDTTAGTGFMHESFQSNNAADFTRPWFAWANTLFGELIVKLAAERPSLIQSRLD
jgi:uncharacterized protein